MISLLLSTLVTTSFAMGPTFVVCDVAPVYPGFDQMFAVDPVLMQKEQELEAFLQFEALQSILSELQQAMEEKRMFEVLMFRLEEQKAEREWAAFITRLQQDPQFAEMVFEQYPEFFDQFTRGAQPEEQQQEFYERYPEVQAAVYNPLFPTKDNGDAVSATREETAAFVAAQIKIGGCPVTEKPTKLNYFSALGLTSTASAKDVKKAYRDISLQVHPDKHTNKNTSELAKTAFQTLSKIYTYLSDPAHLAAYQKATKKQFEEAK